MSFKYDYSQAILDYKRNTDRERASSHNSKADHSDIHDKGLTYTATNNHNVNKQQRKKKSKGQKSQHHMKDKWKRSSGGGNHESKQTPRKAGRDFKQKGGKWVSRRL